MSAGDTPRDDLYRRIRQEAAEQRLLYELIRHCYATKETKDSIDALLRSVPGVRP